MTKVKFNTEIAKKILLTTAGIGAGVGAVALLVAMPGLGLVAKEIIDWYKNKNRYKRYQIRQTFEELCKNKLLEFKDLPDGSTKIVVAEKGRRKILHYKFNDLKITNQDIWDKKWRFVIFDLPKKYEVKREIFRRKLKSLEFQQLQKSVWIHAWPCQKEIDFIIEYLNINPFVYFFEVDNFDPGKKVKNLFM